MSASPRRKRWWARPIVAGPLIIGAVGAAFFASRLNWGSLIAGGVDLASLPLEERVFNDESDFLDGYWQRIIPLQGLAPENFSPLEASLQPSMCGTCHPQQYEDWQTTIHSAAYSPGLSGQLVNMPDYGDVRACLTCHAPLSEQSEEVPDTSGALVASPVYDNALKQSGLACAACHVRGWRRYGPPTREGSVAPSAPGSPHGGVVRSSYFENSRFCADCHQFAAPAPNGKSLQNTYVEWQASRYAADGISCQGCHMPERRHRWRGIHDPEMVLGGVTIEWVEPPSSRTPGEAVALRVTNSGTGHRFPTYVTPKVIVRIELLDKNRLPIRGAVAEATIGRKVEARGGLGWVELSDTRLAPDSSLTVLVKVTGSGAGFARGAVIIDPDDFYRGAFAGMLTAELSDTSRALITEAHRRTTESSFTIFDDTIAVD